jgi:endonuclease/exonuclease/phosphatase family metal-dependent hydrolase
MERNPAVIAKELHAGGYDTASLLFLQEVLKPGPTSPPVSQFVADRLRRHHCFSPSFTRPDGSTIGLAILSSQPLHDCRTMQLPVFELRFRSRTRVAQYAHVHTPAGTTLIVNVHLDTRLNLPDRIKQLEPLLHLAESSAHPTLIAGDFNTNPYRWIGSMLPIPFSEDQASGLLEYMTRRGYSTPLTLKTVTHDALRMQLDWVFLRGLSAEKAEAHPIDFSDHYAIRVRFRGRSSD